MQKIKTTWTEITATDGTAMDLFVAYPSNSPASPSPAILVLQEAFGVNEHIQEVTIRFAEQGFVAVAPDLFHRTGRRVTGDYNNFQGVLHHYLAVTKTTLDSDLPATYDWLKKQPEVNPSQIASIGFCMGGKASFIANAILPLQAAICFYGGGIAPDFLPLAKDQHAPVLLAWGGSDDHIPVEQRQTIAKALTDAGKDFTQLEFAKAGHGFFCDKRESYHPASAKEAWAIALEFLRNHL